MVDRREEADGGEAERDLERRPREGGHDRARADAEEEDHDHPFAAPLVREPAGRDRGHPEGDESRRRVGDEGGVAHPPLVGEPQRGDGREDEHEEVVEEVPDVQEQEAETVARHTAFPKRAMDSGAFPGEGGTAERYASPLSHRAPPEATSRPRPGSGAPGSGDTPPGSVGIPARARFGLARHHRRGAAGRGAGVNWRPRFAKGRAGGKPALPGGRGPGAPAGGARRAGRAGRAGGRVRIAPPFPEPLRWKRLPTPPRGRPSRRAG